MWGQQTGFSMSQHHTWLHLWYSEMPVFVLVPNTCSAGCLSNAYLILTMMLTTNGVALHPAAMCAACLPAGFVWQTTENEWGHAVVATALSVVDDTALTSKLILGELKVGVLLLGGKGRGLQVAYS